MLNLEWGEQHRQMMNNTANQVQVQIGHNIRLEGNLNIPENARGVVLFAHGSGSSRFSPRNQYVAGVLQNAGFATLLIDLLTPQEEVEDMHTARLRFDIPLLSQRVVGATNWLTTNPSTSNLKIGYFGASTGAAAALIAASELPLLVGAVVSRGGRPDLAGSCLTSILTPTLLIVGGNDPEVIELNRMAFSLLRGPKELEIVPGATHLFEEPGALEKVAQLAGDWFTRYLAG
ncbi:MAG TPA: dienelactone hydrolase family protein [Ktedonobacteraceae bacterium]|nr:dienelactone hydrolase family protein [Ktedonobacteraceae bacterium]